MILYNKITYMYRVRGHDKRITSPGVETRHGVSLTANNYIN